MAALRDRIALYDKRVADAQVEVASAEAEAFTAEKALKAAQDATAEQRKAAVKQAQEKSLDEYRREYEAELEKKGQNKDSLTTQNVEIYKKVAVYNAGALPKEEGKVYVAKNKLEDAQTKLRRASRELRDSRKELDALEKLPPCPSQTSVSVQPDQNFASASVHFFAGIEGGGGWSNTTFTTSPTFDVNGTGGLLGVNAGILVNIPGTDVALGGRFGWLGSGVSGQIERPPASPFFDYEVRTRHIFYQEMLARLPIGPQAPAPSPRDRIFVNYNYFATVSLGVAEVRNDVIGTSGAFHVTDSYTQTGATVSAGLGMPIFQTANGITVNMLGQYRMIFLQPTDVRVPGKVGNEFWQQGLTFGLEFRY